MASTYVNDLRLNEMATGDASGSWGTVTNTNLELIGEAFSYGTETIGDADSTLTIADGAADAARSFYLKITSSVDLTTTRIVTLGPNTVSKVWMIENATTGSQVITIKQGSGATINVPNGQVKMISTDGAGSGGAVLDLLVDVDLTGTTTLVNLDVSGTLGVTGVLTATSLDISGDIDVDGTTNLDVVDIDGAVDMASTLLVTGVLTTTAATVSNGGGQFNGAINVGVDDTGYDVKFFGATAGAYMLWDESADDLILGGAAGLSVNSAALVTGVLTANGGAVFNESGADVDFRVESNTNANALFVQGSDGNVGIGTSSPDELLHIHGATQSYIKLTDDDSGQGATDGALFAFDGSSATQYIWNYENGPTVFANNSTERMRIDSTGRVGIGRTPTISNSKLEVGGADNVSLINVEASGVTGGMGIGSTGLQFFHGSTARMRIDSSGNLLVGKTATAFGTAGIEARAGGTLWATASETNAASFNRLSTDGAIAYFSKDGTTVGSIDSRAGVVSTIILNPASGNGAGLSGGTKCIVPADEAGIIDNDVSLGVSSYRFKDLYLSGGVYLGGTVAANLLDDYEEGVHQTAITMSGSGTVTLSASYDSFSYTKVGRLVTITGNPRIASVSSPVGIMAMTLPFTAASGQTDECRAGGMFRYYDNDAGAGAYIKIMSWYVQEGTSTLSLDNANTNGNVVTPDASDEFYFSISYITA
jgi:hypothetical protein